MPEDKHQVESKADDGPSGSDERKRSMKGSEAVSRPKEKMQFTKTALVVVGMHRSGTSAISRILNLLGADMAKNVLPPRPSNPAGFWESKELMKLHDTILEAVGTTWDDPGYLPAFWEDNEFAQAYQEKFAAIINTEFNGSRLFVLKDPRISRFIPLTVEALEKLGIAPKFVVAIRNPLEVAASLDVRDDFHLEKSLLLWLDHSLRAEKMTRDFPRAFVPYDEVLKDWRSAFRSVAANLQLTFPAWTSRNDALVESFISPKLRHHAFSLEDTIIRDDVAQWVKETYETLRAPAGGQLSLANEKGLNRIYSELKKAQKLFGPILAQRQLSLQRVIKERDEAHRNLNERLAAIDNSGQTINRPDSEVVNLRSRYESETNQLDDAYAKLVERENEVNQLSKELENIRSELSLMQCKVKDLRSGTETLRLEYDSATSERNDALKQADTIAIEKHSLLQQVKNQIEVTAVLRQQLNTAGKLNETIRHSYLWRVMSPVRALGTFSAGFFEKVRVARQLVHIGRTRGLEKARRLLDDRKLLMASALFDIGYYINKNPGVRDAGVDPVVHYLTHGAENGRYPNPLFDSDWYLKNYPDVARSGMNPLKHFLLYGAREKRDPNPLFQTSWYVEQYPDVAASGVNPLAHYLGYGGTQGYNPNPLFDGEWYLKHNPAVAEAGINPLVHYMEQGWREGRNPSERFDLRYYLENNRDVAADGGNPLTHYLRVGMAEGRVALRPRLLQALPYTRIEGNRCLVKGWRTILIVAHFVSERLFGAERSFLDMLDGLSEVNVNVIAVLPGSLTGYTDEVRARCSDVIIFKYNWWQKGRRVSDTIVEKFESVISNHGIDAVHVNTIMLREPLIAASKSGVASVVHVRELIRDDKWLAEAIGEPPEEIVKQVLATTDWIIANSEATKNAFEKTSSTFVIPNPVDLNELDIPNIIDPVKVRFGLISSNIRKKGIEDLVELARACEFEVPNARFILVGPETRLIKELRLEQGGGNVPGSIEFAGYADSPKSGIEKVNVVLNLSRFKESFGRTVVEAMAARRPAIAYDWGALPELIVDGVTGFLIPYCKPELAVPAIKELCRNVDKVVEMGAAGRSRAEKEYSKQRYSEQLHHAYFTIFRQNDRNGKGLPSPMLHPGEQALANPIHRRKKVDVSVIIPNYNYADYLPERLNSILGQSVLPREIIFVDDASQDESVRIARSILEQSAVPFTVRVNKNTLGPYGNWKKGMFLAHGSYIWIAEADDSCDPGFLETVLTPVNAAEDIVVSYCQSRKIDDSGNVITSDSFAHTDEISPVRWRSSYVELGVREVVDALAYRNTIPNVSACIIKRSAAIKSSDVLDSFRYCGDWAFYASMLRNGRIAYDHRSLNAFRRHGKSQTRRNLKSADFIIEVARVRSLLCRDFPLRLSQFSRMDHFLNKDYPVESIPVNASYPPVEKIIDSAGRNVKDRKLIAFVTTNNGSYSGGSEVLWREAALALRNAGHDIVALIKKWVPAPDFFREFEEAGIKLYFKDEEGFDKLISHDPDLVIISTGDQDEGTEYFGELIKHDLKYVIVNQLTKEERFWPVRAEKQDAVRAGYTNAARVFFTCKNNHRVMESRLRSALENVDYHFNPFHVDRNKVPPFPATSDGYHIAVPSKLLYIHKGQDLLIEVLNTKKWRQRPVRINMYGIGDDREKMEKRVSELGIENLVFRGRVPDISEIWKENHAILMPSRMEGIPIMLVSAMLSARLPIVTDVGGHAELVADQVCGFVAENPDVESIDAAMEKAWTVREDWQDYAKRARARVLEFLPDDPVVDFLSKIHRVMEDKVERAI